MATAEAESRVPRRGIRRMQRLGALPALSLWELHPASGSLDTMRPESNVLHVVPRRQEVYGANQL
eukprot:CAMPEP_0185449364 /NCGR_PEP_ID=MMETSP1365-20130426/60725_1 /TAXON_ID=38817 /ORGANISM="Gephyrocapsa oceanica, Strain RCC1303" /LENGTH=64 /DNA_ID=CAMNT_0028055393 /DNA_START=196 /DNA_END=390 /DNA_ORIENTATION=+